MSRRIPRRSARVAARLFCALLLLGARGLMQLMPATFHQVVSGNPEMEQIDDATRTIAAGIWYDRTLRRAWETDSVAEHRADFIFASSNAGRGTIRSPQSTARQEQLDARAWPSIETVAPRVRHWRWREPIGNVKTIDRKMIRFASDGRIVPATSVPPPAQ